MYLNARKNPDKPGGKLCPEIGHSLVNVNVSSTWNWGQSSKSYLRSLLKILYRPLFALLIVIFIFESFDEPLLILYSIRNPEIRQEDWETIALANFVKDISR